MNPLATSPLQAAQDVLGVNLIVDTTTATIIETEAYGHSDDLASHTAKGKTARNATMFGKPGLLYVYLIYGLHYCLNIVAHQPSTPAGAVLIRSVVIDGKVITGPGRVAKRLGLNRNHDGTDLLSRESSIRLELDNRTPLPTGTTIKQSPRVGISRAMKYPWRFRLIFPT